MYSIKFYLVMDLILQHRIPLQMKITRGFCDSVILCTLHMLLLCTSLYYRMVSQNVQGWKGPLWVIYSNPPAEAGSPTAGCTGPHPGRS